MEPEDNDVIDDLDCDEDLIPESFNDKLGQFVIEVTGTMWFAYITTLSIIIWMAIEIIRERILFDKYDLDFPVLSMVMGIFQVLVPTFILVGQVQQSVREKHRDKVFRDWMCRRDAESLETQKKIMSLENVNIKLLNNMKIQQEILIRMQSEQSAYKDFISKELLDILSSVSESTKERPCLMNELNPEILKEIIMRNMGDESDACSQ